MDVFKFIRERKTPKVFPYDKKGKNATQSSQKPKTAPTFDRKMQTTNYIEKYSQGRSKMTSPKGEGDDFQNW